MQSEAGKGSRFRVTIPFTMVAQNEPHIETAYPESAGHPHAPHVKILLVEDNKANITVATALLEAFGYSYDVAQSGEEALKKLEQGKFDLILMDVQMPGMDGYQITRIIRQCEATSGGISLLLALLPMYCRATGKNACRQEWTIILPNRLKHGN